MCWVTPPRESRSPSDEKRALSPGQGYSALSLRTGGELFGDPQPGQAKGTCEQERNATEQVDGPDAEGVGGHAAESEDASRPVARSCRTRRTPGLACGWLHHGQQPQQPARR